MTNWILVSLLFFAVSTQSQNLISEFGQAPGIDQKKESQFTLITWNIYKGGIDGLYDDLQLLAQKSDFLLTQEFLLNDSQKQLMANNSQSHWALAKSFMDGGEWTGVATMSRWQPTESVAIRSPGTEPFAGTPKMTLISKYNVAGKELWLVNLHGLNFDITHSSFMEQIDDVVSKIKSHQGPMIFAGDFNTWSDSRLEHLIQKTKSLGLERAPLENPMGFFSATLDHIFYRDLKAVEFKLLSDFETSDHVPLQIRFEL